MLNNHPREKLRFIIEEYGRSAIRDSNRCRELLREHAPENLRETNLLMQVLTEGFVSELTSENLELFAQRLHDEFGIKEEFAFWAIESWAFALNLINAPMIQKITKEDVIALPEKEIFSLHEDEIEADSPIQKIESIEPIIKKEDLIEQEEFWRIAEGKYFPPEYEVERKKAWLEIENISENNTTITGRIQREVSGGFIVKIGFLNAFLPGSLAGVIPGRSIDIAEGEVFEFKVIKIDLERKNVVVSRSAVINEKYSSEIIEELWREIEEDGAIMAGTVSNMSKYGAFIDLGGVYGLLHMKNMTWHKVPTLPECVKIGQHIKVKVLEHDKEKNRVSLGLKQLSNDPWQDITQRYLVGMRVIGKVNRLTDYGCFIEIENGVEGLAHISEMGWEDDVIPSELVKLGDRVEVVILEIDEERRCISLSMKQCKVNPWNEFEHPKLLNSTTLKLKTKDKPTNSSVPLLKDEATQNFEDMF